MNGRRQQATPSAPARLGDPIQAGEIGVAAYVSIPQRDKPAGECRGLIGAVLEQQVPTRMQVRARLLGDRRQRL